MANKTVTSTIKHRQGAAATWESKNPVLAAGELGYDTTNKRTKIGDGVTPWNDLDWFAVKKKPTFAESDWAEIAEISKSGAAATTFKVGDERTIELTTGEEVTLVILGFNHDDLQSGGKAGITIGMKELLATRYAMNSSGTNAGGWDTSKMRTDTMSTLLPADLQTVIKTVNKKATAGGQSETITTSADKLFLLAMSEIYSKTSIENSTTATIKDYAAAYNAEGTQYEYYRNLIGDNNGGTATNAALIKRLSNGGGSADTWWLRSPNASDTASFRYIYSTGSAYTSIANNSCGVSFGFCV